MSLGGSEAKELAWRYLGPYKDGVSEWRTEGGTAANLRGGRRWLTHGGGHGEETSQVI